MVGRYNGMQQKILENWSLFTLWPHLNLICCSAVDWGLDVVNFLVLWTKFIYFFIFHKKMSSSDITLETSSKVCKYLSDTSSDAQAKATEAILEN